MTAEANKRAEDGQGTRWNARVPLRFSMMEREMLVLTRKLNQEIVIGDEIRITIVAVGGDQVKLGITAPRSVPVHRLEVYQERQNDARALEKVVPA